MRINLEVVEIANTFRDAVKARRAHDLSLDLDATTYSSKADLGPKNADGSPTGISTTEMVLLNFDEAKLPELAKTFAKAGLYIERSWPDQTNPDKLNFRLTNDKQAAAEGQKPYHVTMNAPTLTNVVVALPAPEKAPSIVPEQTPLYFRPNRVPVPSLR